MSRGNFFAELKRRNVYKVAVAYAVVAWLVIQISTATFPVLELPNWASKFVIALAVIGFPIALIIAWAFEMTPEGMKRTEDIRPDEKIPQWSRRKFAALILVITIAAASLLGYQVFRAKAPASPVTNNQDVPLKSIAVLPFENLSDDKGNAYFADGIQEEIMTRLAKIADLKVISRTSTQRFKSAPADLKEIAKQLGVANILEGSVQKSSGQIRISVQLINALNDSHLWAETYDRKLIDVFQVETDLAQKIAVSLEAKLTGRERKEIAVRGTTNAEAYDAFLHALSLLNRQGVADLEEAIKFSRRAVELDPKYAEAWCTLAFAESQKYFYPDHTEGQLARARTATETAIRLAPDSAEAAGALGVFNYYCLKDYDAALTQLELSRSRAPNNADVLVGIGNVKRRKGLLDESIAIQQEAAQLDPLNEDIWVNIGRGYRGLRRFDEARTMFDHAHAIAPSDQEVVAQRAETYLAQGDLETAWRSVEALKFASSERGFGFQVVVLIFQRRFDYVEKMVAPVVDDPQQSPLFRAIPRVTLAYLRLAKNDRAAAESLFAQAETELNQLRAAGDDGILLREVLLGVEANLGHREQAQTIADSLLETTRSDLWEFPRSEEAVARAYVALHDFDRALPLLEHALKVPAVEAITPAHLRLDPSWDPIRNDPRFQKLANAK